MAEPGEEKSALGKRPLLGTVWTVGKTNPGTRPSLIVPIVPTDHVRSYCYALAWAATPARMPSSLLTQMLA